MMRLNLIRFAGIVAGIVACLYGGGASAGEAEIVAVNVIKSGPGVYRFDVTVRHADTGWDHYADGWDVLDSDGKILGKRVLYHPHVDEQPFTRSLGGVAIPAGTESVGVRVHDKVHGFGSKIFTVDLPRQVN
jgi:hypothetical protein